MKAISEWSEALKSFDESAERHGGVGHYSIPQNEGAQIFKGIVDEYAKGRVLDVGCGGYFKSIYLDGIDDGRITGVDPIDRPHPFAFFNMPYEDMPDESFDTAICATSLDHVKDAASVVRKMARNARRLIFWHQDTAPTPASHHTWQVTQAEIIQMSGKGIVYQSGDHLVLE